jgi:hypothetical protein
MVIIFLIFCGDLSYFGFEIIINELHRLYYTIFESYVVFFSLDEKWEQICALLGVDWRLWHNRSIQH